MESKASVHFSGLNALRFLAASLVIFHHVEQYKFWAGYPNLWGNPLIDSLGHKAVSFFFVLSGFLITYLLMAEHQRNGSINLPRFYMRRVLRIWPLYFLIVLLALLIIPSVSHGVFDHPNLGIGVFMGFLLFVPNLLRISVPNIVGANQLWSVGVEEQFYLIWPILIRRFIGQIIPFLFAFVSIKLGVHLLIHAGLMYAAGDVALRLSQFERLYALFPVEQMAIGGLGAAALYYGKTKVLSVIHSHVSFYLSIALIVALSFSSLDFTGITYLEAGLFIVVIMNICQHKYLHQPLENPLFTYLGNISYGIYMWHTVIIALLLSMMGAWSIPFSAPINLTLHLLSFAGTLAVSHFSYKYFEVPFLKFKERFAFDNPVKSPST